MTLAFLTFTSRPGQLGMKIDRIAMGKQLEGFDEKGLGRFSRNGFVGQAADRFFVHCFNKCVNRLVLGRIVERSSFSAINASHLLCVQCFPLSHPDEDRSMEIIIIVSSYGTMPWYPYRKSIE